MANEVNNETNDSTAVETPVSEQANTNDSVAAAADATQPAGEMSAKTEQPSAPEEDFGSILEKFEQEQTIFHNGDLVEGKVVNISDRGVLIDFGYKSEGIAPIEDFTSPTGEVSVKKGDVFEVIIKSISVGDVPPMLSRSDVLSRKAWTVIEKAYNEETPVIGHVLEVTKGGLRVDLDGVEAFLPGSLVDSRPIRNLNSFVGQDIEAQIIKFSRKRNNIVLSRKVLTDKVVNEQKQETLGNIQEGYIVEGTVKNLTEYGAFLDIGGIDGLLHVTDMSWGRLQNPGELFKVNDTVQVKILKLDRAKEKVALGYKQLLADPWSTVIELYPVNAKMTGRVSSVTDYGAFVELEPGVEGLVHVSEMSWSKRSPSPKKLVRSGDEVEVQILGVDTEERRISLGMKQLQPNPWQTVYDRYHIGQTVRGRVRNLTDFGAFIEIEDGIDGLVHVSDITHSKKLKHAKDVLKRDQEVEAVIKNIDVENRRMALSIKELTPSAWDAFVSTHRPGDVVRGKISRFTGFGVFVELGNDLEGLCHISELSDERIERPEEIGAIGQEMDFKILRIEHDVQKIGLSHRAVGKDDEPIVDTKSYSTEAKGGMASLGELMNLKRTGGEEESKSEEPRLSKKERKALQAKERAEQEEAAAQAQPEAEAEPTAETTEAEATTEEVTAENADEATAETADEVTAENADEVTAKADDEVSVAPETVSETSDEAENSAVETTPTVVEEETPPTAETEDQSAETSATAETQPSEETSDDNQTVAATAETVEETSAISEETPVEETLAEESSTIETSAEETPTAETSVVEEETAVEIAPEPSVSETANVAETAISVSETETPAETEPSVTEAKAEETPAPAMAKDDSDDLELETDFAAAPPVQPTTQDSARRDDDDDDLLDLGDFSPRNAAESDPIELDTVDLPEEKKANG